MRACVILGNFMVNFLNHFHMVHWLLYGAIGLSDIDKSLCVQNDTYVFFMHKKGSFHKTMNHLNQKSVFPIFLSNFLSKSLVYELRLSVKTLVYVFLQENFVFHKFWGQKKQKHFDIQMVIFWGTLNLIKKVILKSALN